MFSAFRENHHRYWGKRYTQDEVEVIVCFDCQGITIDVTITLGLMACALKGRDRVRTSDLQGTSRADYGYSRSIDEIRFVLKIWMGMFL